MRRVICPYCGCEEYEIFKSTGEARDEDGSLLYKYPVEFPQCKECESPLVIPEYTRKNKKAAADAMRAHVEILSLEEIKALPRRYNIPRTEFEVVMGIKKYHDENNNNSWTSFEIWEGDLPNDEEEERLRAIQEDPKVYVEFLKKSKGKIPDETYNRSMKRALNLVKKQEK